VTSNCLHTDFYMHVLQTICTRHALSRHRSIV